VNSGSISSLRLSARAVHWSLIWEEGLIGGGGPVPRVQFVFVGEKGKVSLGCSLSVLTSCAEVAAGAQEVEAAGGIGASRGCVWHARLCGSRLLRSRPWLQ
jgi:hypothetical protein